MLLKTWIGYVLLTITSSFGLWLAAEMLPQYAVYIYFALAVLISLTYFLIGYTGNDGYFKGMAVFLKMASLSIILLILGLADSLLGMTFNYQYTPLFKLLQTQPFYSAASEKAVVIVTAIAPSALIILGFCIKSLMIKRRWARDENNAKTHPDRQWEKISGTSVVTHQYGDDK